MTKKQNDTQAKPSVLSAGALRAARRLLRAAQSAGTELNMYDEEIAKIIDRETGVGGLLEAAKLAIGYLHNYPGAQDILKQAITKCKGKGSE